MREVIQRLADGLFAIAGAAGLSQFPEFFQQYLQRLGGRLDQAVVQENRIAGAARDHGLAMADYVQRLNANTDPLVRSEGQNVAAALADADRLRGAHEALTTAASYERPAVLARYFDENLARATLDQFVPAVPLSIEGLIYAGTGMVIGLMLLAGGQRTAKAAVRGVRGGPAST